MRSHASLSLFFFMLFAVAVQNGLTGCTMKDFCKDNNGYCIKKVNADQCTGTVYNKGCSGQECACCIGDISICVAKPHCENDGGKCLGKGKWKTCKEGTVDSSGCHGDGCACCKTGACKPENACTSNKGYCFETASNHKCRGTSLPLFCGSSCSCCFTG